MKKTITGIFLLFTTITIGQENLQKQNNNHFKLEFQAGLGFGFKNIDAFIDENNKTSTISGGGGYNINLGGRYIFNNRFELGTSFGFHSSSLRPQLSNVSTTFNRISILPTFKYLISLNKDQDQSINIGLGYGFYINGKLDIDANALGIRGNQNYNSASGIHLITEYEIYLLNKLGYTIGLRYYGVNYDIQQKTGERDFDVLNGSGIDLYIGISYRLQ